VAIYKVYKWLSPRCFPLSLSLTLLSYASISLQYLFLVMLLLHHAGLALASLCLVQAQSSAQSLVNAIYKDASQPIDARVENLVSLMTLEEKMAQLMQGKTHAPETDYSKHFPLKTTHRRHLQLAQYNLW
jgi:hypothetical protein